MFAGSDGLKCTPLTIEVYPRKDIESTLTDEGFEPKIIRVDEGNSVRWSWSGCEQPHSIQEANFSHKTGRLTTKEGQTRFPIGLTRYLTNPNYYTALCYFNGFICMCLTSVSVSGLAVASYSNKLWG